MAGDPRCDSMLFTALLQIRSISFSGLRVLMLNLGQPVSSSVCSRCRLKYGLRLPGMKHEAPLRCLSRAVAGIRSCHGAELLPLDSASKGLWTSQAGLTHGTPLREACGMLVPLCVFFFSFLSFLLPFDFCTTQTCFFPSVSQDRFCVHYFRLLAI